MIIRISYIDQRSGCAQPAGLCQLSGFARSVGEPWEAVAYNCLRDTSLALNALYPMVVGVSYIEIPVDNFDTDSML